MGSAFAVPCADNSNQVFLVGSFLEDKVIEEINNLNNFHPILKSQLPKNIKDRISKVIFTWLLKNNILIIKKIERK